MATEVAHSEPSTSEDVLPVPDLVLPTLTPEQVSNLIEAKKDIYMADITQRRRQNSTHGLRHFFRQNNSPTAFEELASDALIPLEPWRRNEGPMRGAWPEALLRCLPFTRLHTLWHRVCIELNVKKTQEAYMHRQFSMDLHMPGWVDDVEALQKTLKSIKKVIGERNGAMKEFVGIMKYAREGETSQIPKSRSQETDNLITRSKGGRMMGVDEWRRIRTEHQQAILGQEEIERLLKGGEAAVEERLLVAKRFCPGEVAKAAMTLLRVRAEGKELTEGQNRIVELARELKSWTDSPPRLYNGTAHDEANFTRAVKVGLAYKIFPAEYWTYIDQQWIKKLQRLEYASVTAAREIDLEQQIEKCLQEKEVARGTMSEAALIIKDREVEETGEMDIVHRASQEDVSKHLTSQKDDSNAPPPMNEEALREAFNNAKSKLRQAHHRQLKLQQQPWQRSCRPVKNLGAHEIAQTRLKDLDFKFVTRNQRIWKSTSGWRDAKLQREKEVEATVKIYRDYRHALFARRASQQGVQVS